MPREPRRRRTLPRLGDPKQRNAVFELRNSNFRISGSSDSFCDVQKKNPEKWPVLIVHAFVSLLICTSCQNIAQRIKVSYLIDFLTAINFFFFTLSVVSSDIFGSQRNLLCFATLRRPRQVCPIKSYSPVNCSILINTLVDAILCVAKRSFK